MSVIAWDGKTLAADRQAVINGMKVRTCKLCRLPDGKVCAWVGARAHDWPDFQRDEHFCRLIVASLDGVVEYE